MSGRRSPVFKHSTKKNSISSLNKQVKASKPVVLSHDIPPGTKLTFVDISHSLATIDIESKFNKFCALVDTANLWLEKNYLWKLQNCETVGLVFENEKLDPSDFGATQRLLRSSVNHDLGDCTQLKALRLWISRREDVPEMRKHVDIQKLSYQTYLPQGCRFYENQIGWQQLNDVIETINEDITKGSISGQLLNIESILYDSTEEWVVDTECPKPKDYIGKQETALRVYYVTNAKYDCSHEEVVVFDFVPDVISASSPPKFEPFNALLFKLQDFMEENPEYKYLNTQSVDIKFRSVDEMHTYYMVHTNDVGHYLRILRLVCTKPSPARHRHMERQLTHDTTHPPNQIKSAIKEREDTEAKKQDSPDAREAPDIAAEAPGVNIEAHVFEILHNPNVLHGPYYPVKRAIEDFMERPEWVATDERRPNSKWKYLCSETIAVLANSEEDIQKKLEISLFSNRHNLFILIPRIYYAIRIFFDTSDVIEDRSYKSPNRLLKKCQSESFEKMAKAPPLRNQSLPSNALQHIQETTEATKTFRKRIKQSIACSII